MKCYTREVSEIFCDKYLIHVKLKSKLINFIKMSHHTNKMY